MGFTRRLEDTGGDDVAATGGSGANLESSPVPASPSRPGSSPSLVGAGPVPLRLRISFSDGLETRTRK